MRKHIREAVATFSSKAADSDTKFVVVAMTAFFVAIVIFAPFVFDAVSMAVTFLPRVMKM